MSFLKIGKKPEAAQLQVDLQSTILCEKLNFAASEAYKRLRTNLTFTMPTDKKCCVVGITSAERGEGKSTTSINLSYTMAEAGKKTLLIEADMRLPAIARRMNMEFTAGLSNMLVGQAKPDDVLYANDKFENPVCKENWWLLPSGDIPPNPSELLGSQAMQTAIEHYSESFDFIIVDLPPVTVVSDALAISEMLDGILLAVRQDYADKNSVGDAVKQFQFSDARLLGFVLTCVGGENARYKKNYRKYRYYKRYGSYGGAYGKYGYGYDYGYDYGYGYGKGYGYGYDHKHDRKSSRAAKAAKSEAADSEQTESAKAEKKDGK